MRKKYSSDIKTQIVLEMLKEERTMSELASQYGIHPTQLHRWRNHVLENLPQLFEEKDNTAAVKAEYEHKIEELYTELGRLTTQLAWLKKKGIRPD
jgi:transposase-like protein